MTKTNVDYKNGNKTQGEVAQFMQAKGLTANQMRPFVGSDGESYITVFENGEAKVKPIQTNATLRRDEWKRLDEAINTVSKERLVGIQDLISKGLTFNLNNPMAHTVLETHNSNVEMEAGVSMDGQTRGRNNRPEYSTNYLPLPIIHVDYDINARVLSASRNLGNPIDSTNAEDASRAVSATLEDMLFTDKRYDFGGGTIYSYVNHPDRNTITMDTDWNDSTAGANIIKDIRNMKQASLDANQYGPWMLYIPKSYETLMDDDYDVSGASNQTYRDRILQINNIQDVKVVDKLVDDNVLLVQMTSSTIRLVRGMGIKNVQWDSGDKMVHHYKVMTIQVPQIRSDKKGQSGIVHLS